jgi:hypothetical protein
MADCPEGWNPTRWLEAKAAYDRMVDLTSTAGAAVDHGDYRVGTFLMITAFEQATRTMYAVILDRGVATRGKVADDTLPRLSYDMEFDHPGKFLIGVSTAMLFGWAHARGKLLSQHRRDDPHLLKERDRLANERAAMMEKLTGLFPPERRGLREACLFTGTQRDGNPLPEPPGEGHYQILADLMADLRPRFESILKSPVTPAMRKEEQERARVLYGMVKKRFKPNESSKEGNRDDVG